MRKRREIEDAVDKLAEIYQHQPGLLDCQEAVLAASVVALQWVLGLDDGETLQRVLDRGYVVTPETN